MSCTHAPPPGKDRFLVCDRLEACTTTRNRADRGTRGIPRTFERDPSYPRQASSRIESGWMSILAPVRLGREAGVLALLADREREAGSRGRARGRPSCSRRARRLESAFAGDSAFATNFAELRVVVDDVDLLAAEAPRSPRARGGRGFADAGALGVDGGVGGDDGDLGAVARLAGERGDLDEARPDLQRAPRARRACGRGPGACATR